MTSPSPWLLKAGNTALIVRWMPNTFTSNSARACSVVNASEMPAERMPALLTRTSRRPAFVDDPVHTALDGDVVRHVEFDDMNSPGAQGLCMRPVTVGDIMH
ncbi:hypothetical protein AWB67_07119 [Caballeronia terrestris]|uniref:Uncharacterized protein n=1 Tax=Caballeronia terrestris TaxID=1226301 RepID=A0A158KZH4_9BURK|nr:hypothetical protein AWB67_07119 [Caballeronia terrestris]